MTVREWMEAYVRIVRTSPRQVSSADVKQLITLVQERSLEPCGRHSTGHLWGRESYIVKAAWDIDVDEPDLAFYRYPTGLSDLEWVEATTPGLGPIHVGSGPDRSPVGAYSPGLPT